MSKVEESNNYNGSPFMIVEDDQGAKIICRNHVIKTCDTLEEAQELIDSKDWQLILCASAIVTHQLMKTGKFEE